MFVVSDSEELVVSFKVNGLRMVFAVQLRIKPQHLVELARESSVRSKKDL